MLYGIMIVESSTYLAKFEIFFSRESYVQDQKWSKIGKSTEL